MVGESSKRDEIVGKWFFSVINGQIFNVGEHTNSRSVYLLSISSVIRCSTAKFDSRLPYSDFYEKFKPVKNGYMLALLSNVDSYSKMFIDEGFENIDIGKTTEELVIRKGHPDGLIHARHRRSQQNTFCLQFGALNDIDVDNRDSDFSVVNCPQCIRILKEYGLR